MRPRTRQQARAQSRGCLCSKAKGHRQNVRRLNTEARNRQALGTPRHSSQRKRGHTDELGSFNKPQMGPDGHTSHILQIRICIEQNKHLKTLRLDFIFLRLSNIPLYFYTTSSFIHLSMDT